MATYQSFYSKLIHILILALMIPSPGTYAQIVSDKSSGAGPDLDNAQNGVPIVNINEASKGGISMNKFEDYNVGKEGVIINNSAKDGISELGGAILANGNLAGREADMVAFDVTGRKRSEIKGATEMFGKKAGFILSNTNGIYVNGGEFINIPNVTLTTGEVGYNEDTDQILYNVQNGEIHIDGSGLNASGTDYVDLISRTMKVTNADIWAGKELNITLGQNEVEQKTGKIKSRTNGSPKPKAALDASEFGAMVAGRIKIISTEDGVGVKSEGDFISTEGDVYINSAGDIKYGGISAQKNINLISEGNIKQSKYAEAGEDITLIAKHTAELKGAYIDANGNIKLDAENTQLSTQKIQANEIKIQTNKAQLNVNKLTAKTLNIEAAEEIESNSNIHIETLNLESSTITNKGNITTNALTLSATNFTNEESATLTAVEKLAIWVYKKASNAGKIQTNNSLELNAEILENSGALYANDTIKIIASDINNSGEMVALKALEITSQKTENTGLLGSLKTILISSAKALLNKGDITADKVEINTEKISHQGELVAGDLSINAGEFKNSGQITANRTLSITAISLENAGKIATRIARLTTDTFKNTQEFFTGTLRLKAGDLNNTGHIESDTQEIDSNTIRNTGALIADTQILKARDIDNSGLIYAGKLELQAEKNITNTGELIGINALSASGMTIENKGRMATLKAMWVSAIEKFKNTGKVDAKNIQVETQEFTNTGKFLASDISISVENIHNEGEITANKTLEIKAKKLVNLRGKLISNDTSIEAHAIKNHGLITAIKTLLISATESFQNTKDIDAQTITIKTETQDNGGRIKSVELAIETTDIHNTGEILASNTNITTNTLTNTDTLYANDALKINARSQIKNEGTLVADTLHINADKIDNQDLIWANTLSVSSNALENTGTLESTTQNIHAKQLANSGIIYGTIMALNATNFTNSGTLYSEKQATLQVENTLQNEGRISANDLKIIGNSKINNEGIIKANEMRLSTDLFNTEGEIVTNKLNVAATTINISGTLETNIALTLNARDISIRTNSLTNIKHILAKTLSINTNTLENTGIIESETQHITAKNLSNSGLLHAKTQTLRSEHLTNTGIIYGLLQTIHTNTLINEATIFAEDMLEIAVENDIKNTGELIGKNKLTLEADNLQNKGLITSLKAALINIKNTLANTGTIESTTLTITSDQLTNEGDLIAEQTKITAETLNNSKEIYADNLTITASTHIENTGKLIGKNAITLNADTATNKGLIASLKTTLIKIKNTLINTGALESEIINLESPNFTNNGTLIANEATLKSDHFTNNQDIVTDTLLLTAKTLLNTNNIESTTQNIETQILKNTGTIFAEDTLVINAEDNIENAGSLIGINNLTLNTDTLQNHGLIASLKTTFLTIKNKLTNTGNIESQTITLTSEELKNDGYLVAKQISIQAEALTNTNEIASETLNITTNTLINSGRAQSSKTLNIDAKNIENTGELISQEAIKLNADNLDNINLLAAQKSLEIKLKNKLKNEGNIESENLNLKSKTLENKNNILADTLTTDTETLKNEGRIESRSQTIQTNSLNNTGILYGLTQTLQASTLDNRGLILAEDQLINTQILTNAGALKAENALSITAENTITNTGDIIGINKLDITSYRLTNKGMLASLKTLILTTRRYLTNFKTISAKEIQLNAYSLDNKGEIKSEKLGTNVSFLTNHGDINTSDQANIISKIINNKGNILANETRITTNALINTGTLYTNDTLKIKASNRVKNEGNLIAESQLNLGAKELENSSTISSKATAEITVETLKNQDKGLIAALKSLTIKTTKALTNKGFIQTQEQLTLEAETLTNDFLIASDGTLIIRAKDLTNTAFMAGVYTAFDLETLKNSGHINSQNDITLDLKTLKNTKGAQISSDKTLKITLENEFENGGDLLGNNLSIEGTTITNKGNFTASDALNINAKNTLNNEAVIFAKDITITTNFLTQNKDAELKAVGSITVSELPSFTNKGLINAGTTIKMSTRENFTNDASIVAGEDLHITSQKEITNTHFLGAAKNLLLSAGEVIKNISGEIWAGEDVNLAAGRIVNEEEGMIIAGKNIFSEAEKVIHNEGKLIATGDIKLSSQLRVRNEDGIIKAGNDLEISTGLELDNSGGYISAEGTLHLHGEGTLLNKDGIIKKGDIPRMLYISGFNTIDNQNGSFYSGRRIYVNDAETLQNQNGTIVAGMGIDIEAETLNNQSGKIIADGILKIEGDKLENKEGYIRASRRMTLDIDTINNDTTQEKNNDGNYIKGIHAAQGLTMTTNKFNNKNGFIYTGEEATLENINNENGIIEANGNLKIRNAENIFQNQNGNITNFAVAGATELFAGNGLNNQSGQIFSNGDIDLEVDDDYEIIGTLESASNITIKARNLINRGRALAGNILRFVATGVFTNEEDATTFAENSLIVEADTLINKGELLSNGEVILKVDTLLHNQEKALIKSTGTTIITGESLTISNNAKIATLSDDLKIQADKLLNNTRITSGGDLNITANTLIENTGEDALLFSNQNMHLYVNNNRTEAHNIGILNNEGTIYSMNDMALSTKQYSGRDTIKNYQGNIESQGNLNIKTSNLLNTRNPEVYEVEVMDEDHFLKKRKPVLIAQFKNSKTGEIKTEEELKSLGYQLVMGAQGDKQRQSVDFRSRHYNGDGATWVDQTDYEGYEDRDILSYQALGNEKKGRILSGNNLSINATDITNYASEISAKNLINIQVENLHNTDILLEGKYGINLLEKKHHSATKSCSGKDWRGKCKGRKYHYRYGWSWTPNGIIEKSEYKKEGALISGFDVKINGSIRNGDKVKGVHNFTPSEQIPDADASPINAPQINLPSGENGLFITDLDDEEGPLIKTNLDDYVDPDGYVGLADYLAQLKDAETPDQENINIDSETLEQYEGILGGALDQNLVEIGKIEGEIKEKAIFTTPVINTEEVGKTDRKTKEKTSITTPVIKLEEDQIVYTPSEIENDQESESKYPSDRILEFEPEYIPFAGNNKGAKIPENVDIPSDIPEKTDLQEIVLNNQYKILPEEPPIIEERTRRDTADIKDTKRDFKNADPDRFGEKVTHIKVERSKKSVSSPESAYKKETNKKFTNIKTLQGSDYYTERIGFNSDEDTRLLGDQFFEQQFIRNQLIEQTGRQYLVSGNTIISDKSLMNMLYTNALEAQKSQGLKVGMTLSADQITALTTDIIWPVEQTINGQKVLVPTLYLSQVTKDNIDTLEGSAIVGEYVTIEGGSLENRGTISSGRNLIIDVDSLENQGGAMGGKIFSGGMARITSNGTIMNKGGRIHANDLLSINSIAGDIINTVITSNKKLGSGREDRLISKGNISAGMALNIAANNIKNIGSSLGAGEAIFIKSKEDFSNEAVKFTRALEWGNGDKTSDKHELANLKTDGSLFVESGGNMSVKGGIFDIKGNFLANISKDMTIQSVENKYNFSEDEYNKRTVNNQKSSIKVGSHWQSRTGGDTTLQGADVEIGNSAIVDAGEDFNIFSVDNTSYEKRIQRKSGSFGSGKTRTFITEKSENIASTFKIGTKGDDSEVEGGSGLRNNMLVVNTGGDMTLLGSDVESSGHTVLDIGGNLNLLAGEDVDTFKYSSKKKGIGSAAQSQSTKMDIIKRGSTFKTGGDLVGTIENKMTLEGAEVNVGGGLDLEAREGVDLLSAEDLHYFKSKKSRSTLGGFLESSSHEIEEIKTRSKGTLVDTVGSASLKTDGEINLVGSSIKSGGDTTLDAGESINIISAVDMDYRYEKKEKISLSGASVENGLEAKQEGTRDSHESTKYTQKESSVGAGGNIVMRSGKDTTIAGSEVIAEKKIDIKNDGNINIISTEEMEDTIDKHGRITATLRARVGNAYVETAEAAADAIEAADDDSKLGKVRAALATAKLAKSAARAAASAGTYGFYASVEQELEIDEKETQETNHTAKTSLILGKEGINLDAEKEINIEGAAVASQGEVVLDGKEGVTIEAAENRQKTNYSHNNYREKKELWNSTNIIDDIEISKSSETQSSERKWYTNSSIEGDKVTIKSEKDVLVSGASVKGREVDMSGIAGDIKVEALQDSETSSRKEEHMSVGGGYSYGKGYGSQEKSWVTNQTQIIGMEKVTVGGKALSVEGAMITTIDENGEDQGGVVINSEKIIVKDIKDRDYAYDQSYDLRSSGSKKTDDGSSGQGSVGGSFSNRGHDREQINRGTIGGGVINSQEVEGNLNRDITKAQELTKDKTLGGINESLDIDMAYIKDFKGTVKEDVEAIKELPKNTRTIVGQPHYYRNRFNNSDKADPDKGGIVMSDKESALHGEGNTKSISPNGGNHERVVSGKTKQVLDEENSPEFMGSYNVFNPRGSALERAGHVIVDVVPYVLFGNSENDPSNIFKRTKNAGKAAVNYAK